MRVLQRSMRHPAMPEVRDQNDLPVEGADVTFRLPSSGPGGIFANQKYTYQTKTNSQGQAGCAKFTVGSQAGRFEVQVTALLIVGINIPFTPHADSTPRFGTTGDANFDRFVTEIKAFLDTAKGFS